MKACDQTVAQHNMAQFMLYRNLIEEECKELSQACEADVLTKISLFYNQILGDKIDALLGMLEP